MTKAQINPYADIIRRVADDNGGPVVVIGKIVPEAVRLIMADPEANKLAVTDAATRSLRQTLTRRARTNGAHVSRQGAMFPNLRQSYAIDIDERVIKDTSDLTRSEFSRVMEIRRDQIAADRAHLAVLEHAATEMEALWDVNPEMTFGEVEKLLVRLRERQGAKPVPSPTHQAPSATH